MESAKIPKRGKIKDAKAEALLKLLRREQEYNDRLSVPKIHQKLPLPAIGSSCSKKLQRTSLCKKTDPTFITQTIEGSSVDLCDERELLSDSNLLWTKALTDVSNNVCSSFIRKNVYFPSYLSAESQAISRPKFNRYPTKSNGRTLPPLEIPASPSCCDRLERPSRPGSESPKHLDDWFDLMSWHWKTALYTRKVLNFLGPSSWLSWDCGSSLPRHA